MAAEKPNPTDIEALATSLIPVAESIAQRFADTVIPIRTLHEQWNQYCFAAATIPYYNQILKKWTNGHASNPANEYMPHLLNTISSALENRPVTLFASSVFVRRHEPQTISGSPHVLTMAKYRRFSDRDWLYFMQQALKHDTNLMSERSTIRTLYPEVTLPEIQDEKTLRLNLSYDAEKYRRTITVPLLQAQNLAF